MDEPLSLDQAFIKKLTDIILTNLRNEKLGVEELSRLMGMSHSTIHRKLRSYTHKSLSQFIREVRLQKAHEMLRQNLGTVAEISYRVGFGSPTYFNKCFHEYYGYPPGDVKKTATGDPDLNNGKPDLLYLSERQNQTIQHKIEGRLHKNYKIALIISSGIFAGLVLIWFIYSTFIKNTSTAATAGTSHNDKSIAVLPFKNLSEDPENQYFANGVMEDILNHLFRISELRVISRTTAEHFRESRLTVPEIAKKLGVNYILEGSAQKYGSKTRVLVQLIDARYDQLLWSEMYDRDVSDLFLIQTEIAKQVAGELEAVLSADEIEQIEKKPTKSPEAYSHYLRGRYFWNLRTQESLKKSVEYFEKSIIEDPNYALAYAGLADAFFIQAYYGWCTKPEGYDRAEKLARKALEIDKTLAEAHATIGGVLCFGNWEWEEARKELKLAIELNPNYSTGHQYYAELLNILGEMDEARSQIDLAVKLDPFSKPIQAVNMACYFNQGKFNEALKTWTDLSELGPEDYNFQPNFFYFYIYLKEDYKAFEAIQKYLLNNPHESKYADAVKDVYARSGVNGILNYIIERELTKPDPSSLLLAKLYAMLGRNNEALDFLEKAFLNRDTDMPYVYNSYDFINLRKESRFKAIMKKMNFPEYKSQVSGSD